MTIISADSHVVEGPDVFTGLADRFGDIAPRVVSAPGKGDCIVIPAKKNAIVNVGHMALAATRLDRGEAIHRRNAHKPDTGMLSDPEMQAYITGGYAAMRPGLTDGARRGEDQDIDGVSAEFLYPGYFAMFSMRDTDLLIALQKNYNDWLKDFCDASTGRLFGLAALPMQDPAAAVRELERVISMGYKGAVIPANAPKGHSYADADYDPVWARAAEANLPLSVHVGCASHNPTWVKEMAARDPLFLYGNTAALVQETLIDLMCHGVCERHPNLTIVVAEFNAGWIAYWLERIDQAWQREYARNPDFGAPRNVREIWQQHFYATIEDDQAALRTQDMIGADRLMWGSDYPHTDSTWPHSAQVIDEMFANLTDDSRQRICYDNVRQLYSLV